MRPLEGRPAEPAALEQVSADLNNCPGAVHAQWPSFVLNGEGISCHGHGLFLQTLQHAVPRPHFRINETITLHAIPRGCGTKIAQSDGTTAPLS